MVLVSVVALPVGVSVEALTPWFDSFHQPQAATPRRGIAGARLLSICCGLLRQRHARDEVGGALGGGVGVLQVDRRGTADVRVYCAGRSGVRRGGEAARGARAQRGDAESGHCGGESGATVHGYSGNERGEAAETGR